MRFWARTRGKSSAPSGAVFFLVALMVLLVGFLDAAPKASTKSLSEFSIAGVGATFDGQNVAVDLAGHPLFGAVTGLVAAFKTDGASVRVGKKPQASGKTANDFTQPVDYSVVAADGSTATDTVRVTVSKVVGIAGYSDTLAVGSDGSLWAMGYNKNGQCGNGNQKDVPVLTQILAGGVAAVAAGLAHSIILKTDHNLWTVGYNNNGELGTGTTTGVLKLVPIRGASLAKGE